MLKLRVLSALVALALLLVVLFAAPPVVADAAIAFVVLAGAYEWSGLLREDNALLRGLFMLLIAALIAAAYVASLDWDRAVLTIALAWWLCALAWVFFYPTPVPTLLAWVGGVCVLVPLFVALLVLYRSAPEKLLFVLFVVWAADVGAYFCGRRFGRVKLAPRISPGKTWEGVIGGLVAVAIVAFAGASWFGLPPMALVPFCMGVAGLSIVGDLTVSIFKRNAGVKDSGRLFPGHGGILDRVDSVAAASPVFALGMLGVAGWS